jgi:Zn finger protein HypA/HybF involved in hydrogenase expression
MEIVHVCECFTCGFIGEIKDGSHYAGRQGEFFEDDEGVVCCPACGGTDVAGLTLGAAQAFGVKPRRTS